MCCENCCTHELDQMDRDDVDTQELAEAIHHRLTDRCQYCSDGTCRLCAAEIGDVRRLIDEALGRRLKPEGRPSFVKPLPPWAEAAQLARSA